MCVYKTRIYIGLVLLKMINDLRLSSHPATTVFSRTCPLIHCIFFLLLIYPKITASKSCGLVSLKLWSSTYIWMSFVTMLTQRSIVTKGMYDFSSLSHSWKVSVIEGRPHHTDECYSFSRLLWHIFPFTVYFFKAAHTQPLTEAEMTKTLYDVCRMTPPSQNLSHTHQNQTFPWKPTICVQLKMYVFSFI